MLNRKVNVLVVLFIFLSVVTIGCSRKTSEQRAEVILTRIAEKLDLNDAQKSKMNAIKEEFTAREPAMRKTREETFDQLIVLMRSPSIEQEKMAALIEKNKAQADDFISFISAKFVEFHDMLTPEQRDNAARLMENWKERYRMHEEKSH